MGNLNPKGMFASLINVVKGPSKMHRLDYAAAPAPGETIVEGAVCSLNNAGLLVNGVSVGTGANRPMPMFAIQGINDFDANSDVGNMSGGVMSAYVATGGYEIETTEFVSAAYKSNDLLTADSTEVGKLSKCTVAPYDAEVVVGCVSKSVFKNADSLDVLSFWSMFLPSNA